MAAYEGFSVGTGEYGEKGPVSYIFSFTGQVSKGQTVIFEKSSYFDVKSVRVDGRTMALSEHERCYCVVLPPLPEGRHTVEYSCEAGEGFDYKPRFIEAFAYPNPARETVTFQASFDEPLYRLWLNVYNVAGELVWETDRFDFYPGTFTYEAFWDLTAAGGTVASGVYICLWTAELSGIKKSEVFKLAVVK